MGRLAFKSVRLLGMMLCLALPLAVIATCGKEEAEKTGTSAEQPFAGKWRGVLETAGGELPFLFEIKEKDRGGLRAAVMNGAEAIPVPIVDVKDDVVKLFFESYNSYLQGKLDPSLRKMTGQFLRNRGGGFKPEMEFNADRNQKDRFAPIEGPPRSPGAPEDISGEWNMVFGEGEDAWEGHGLFLQKANLVAGTVLTEVGDFRYLSGIYEKGVLKLSVFDGAHCFLFLAAVDKDEAMKGHFFSGAKSQTPFTATRGENRLRDPYTLTTVANPEGTFSFAFPDASGRMVTSEDPQFEGKPLLVCIFGTWCPNCHDEAPLLADLYTTYHPKGLEMVSLACEFSGDPVQDRQMVQRFTRKYGIPWPVLILGTSNKKEVAEALPDLDTFLSYPTTLFIGRDGKVRKIHTGFTGPGSGKYFEELKKEFRETIESLL